MSETDTRPAVPAKAGDFVELRCGVIVGPLSDNDCITYPLGLGTTKTYEGIYLWCNDGKAYTSKEHYFADIVAIVPPPPGKKPPPDAVEHPSQYHRTFQGATLDLYRVAKLWGLDSNPLFHAMKKIMMAGERGHKDKATDLKEAIVAIQEELKMMEEFENARKEI